ncbi:MAG TPA: TldD/PmbA family protein [Deltaproteobacteria bacterium]|nr:TldD/PmbA family protein [Deltaproteobacteria bacterium]
MSSLRERFLEAAPAVDRCTLRALDRTFEFVGVRDKVALPVHRDLDRGAMITVSHRGGQGYAATSDLSTSGLRRAAARARDWAEATASISLIDHARVPRARFTGSYRSVVEIPWASVPLIDKIALLKREVEAMGGDPVVEAIATLGYTCDEVVLLSADGEQAEQHFERIAPNITCTASRGNIAQQRSMGSKDSCQQGGYEVLDRVGIVGAGERLRDQVTQLLSAPECPSGIMDVVLAPNQMILQIHESIGHPLELDRILGDERNFAGTSFVTLDMFGGYRYGSELLNITFDPSRPEQLASYRFDDEGAEAERAHLIRDGILVRPLGGALSQHRAGTEGVANARACSWSRAPIDRMANLNLEPGDSSLEQLIAGVERGVWMETNLSWSIDDSRNKFQFGCEWGRLIEDGVLKGVVRNPNYRGISATFWRNLAGVGDESTNQVLGTPYCGKGEPMQVIEVGHASPACRFVDVDVFGGH